jgi:hypothetical protein
MTTPPSPDPIEPAEQTDPGLIADELLIHGLLSVLSQDSEQREKRIQRALNAIAQDQARVFRIRPIVIRRCGAIAAVLILSAIAVYFGLPIEQSAQAIVHSSVAAARTPGDRRYEIRELRDEQTQLSKGPNLVVDTRTGGLTLITGIAPDGHTIIAGRDAQGPWAYRLDGTLTRDDTRRAWPRWTTVGDESLFVDSVDRLLEAVEQAYTLVKKDFEPLEGRASHQFDHIRGSKKTGKGPGASIIDLWIDPNSKLLERMEMRWDKRPPGLGPGLGNGPGPGYGRGDGPGRGEGPSRGDGPGMRDHPHPPPPPGQGPPFFGGPPPEMGPRPGPPTLVVIDRVQSPTLDDSWFSPEAHKE